jgi:acyl transferase domain-containing protein
MAARESRATRLALLFAGQGVLEREPADNPATPARRSFDSAADSSRQSNPDMAVYLASLAACSRVSGTGVKPDVLVGHGFGEIAALVAAGAFSTCEGARIVSARSRVLANSGTSRCRMAALLGDGDDVRTLLGLLEEDGVSLAAQNSPTHHVIVGPDAGITTAIEMAKVLNVRAILLRAAQGPHRADLVHVRTALISDLKDLRQRRMSLPVYSPLLGRYYSDTDDVIECLAEQLVRPIRFADAVSHLTRDGITLFVECGPLRGLASTLECAATTDVEYCRAQVPGQVPNGAREGGLGMVLMASA